MGDTTACPGRAGASAMQCIWRWATLWPLAALVALLSGAGMPEAAEDAVRDKPDIWNVTIGSWAVLEPRFEGARRDSTNWRPILNVRKAGERDWLVLPNDGFDFEVFETDNFRIGPVANWHWQRDVSGTVPRGFRHIGTVDLSLEAGGFAEFWPTEALRTRAEVRHSVVGGKGIIADLTADVVWRPRSDTIVTAGPRVSIADSEFMRAYYTVDQTQSVLHGLPLYSAGAGLRSYGAGSMVKYNWTEQWSTMGFIEYQHLAGAAGDSPVISQRGTENQISAGVGLSYSFTVGR